MLCIYILKQLLIALAWVYKSLIACVLSYINTAWHGNSNSRYRNKLARVINVSFFLSQNCIFFQPYLSVLFRNNNCNFKKEEEKRLSKTSFIKKTQLKVESKVPDRNVPSKKTKSIQKMYRNFVPALFCLLLIYKLPLTLWEFSPFPSVLVHWVFIILGP